MQYLNKVNVKRSLAEEIINPLIEVRKSSPDIYSNTVDPFSAVIDAMVSDISLQDWLVREERRQIQKTLQNKIGELHEIILGNIKGCKRLKVGKIVDLVNDENRLIAEIKNKWNTTKGNHKVDIYDDIESVLNKPAYKNYTGYYVEILPRNRQVYNNPFTPPDNRTGTNRPARQDIRQIDGKSFYALLTGDSDAISKVYQLIPDIIAEIMSEAGLSPNRKILGEKLFKDLFGKAFA